MAKNNYLSRLLLLTLICFHFNAVGDIVKSCHLEPVKVHQVFAQKTHQPAKRHNFTPTKKDLVKQIYDSQIGVREQQNNSGPEVEKYLKYVGLGKGNPWCAAFVCWVYGQAAVRNPRTGWSPNLFPAVKIIWIRGKLRKTITPTKADIFAVYFPDKKRIAHTGFVDSWNGSWVITVEGNTNIAGSREGDGVYRKRRLVSSIYCVARYVDLAELTGN